MYRAASSIRCRSVMTAARIRAEIAGYPDERLRELKAVIEVETRERAMVVGGQRNCEAGDDEARPTLRPAARTAGPPRSWNGKTMIARGTSK